MKKLTFLSILFCISSILLIKCKKDYIEPIESVKLEEKIICASDEFLEQQLKDPKFRKEYENLETSIQQRSKTKFQQRLVNGNLVIPVRVHVLWNTSVQNIADGQIRSAIDVLNEDFNARNSDTSKVVPFFKPLIGNFEGGITFVLDTIIRKRTDTITWTNVTNMGSSAKGGIDGGSGNYYYNIWIGSLKSGLAGMNVKFWSTRTNTDGTTTYNFGTNNGTMLSFKYVGSKAKFPTGYYPSSSMSDGRVLTHETGHWGWLRHMWGSGTCGNDLVDDTPQANAANYGCPVFPHRSTCTGTPIEMTMNYMDYTSCQYMFSKGQMTRMKSFFAPNQPFQTFMQP